MADLFQSVALNVNNPQFLIMQGKVAKVVDMKPAEVLSMLEEAAGTQVYQTKREKTLKELEKCEAKMGKIDDMLSKDIVPILNKLRKERGDYVRWASDNARLDRLRRFCAAADYVEAERLQHGAEEEMQALQNLVQQLTSRGRDLEREMEEMKRRVEELKGMRATQSGTAVKGLQKTADELSRSLVQASSQWDNLKKSIASEEEACSSLSAQLDDIEKGVLADRLDEAKAAEADASGAWKGAAADVRAIECEIEGIASGDGRDESNRTIPERLAAAESQRAAAQGDVKASQAKAKVLSKDLDRHKKGLKGVEKELSKLEAERNKARSKLEAAQTALSGLSLDPAAQASLEQEAARCQKAAHVAEERVAQLSDELSALRFEYADPEARFDRSRVKGPVARLVRVQDEGAMNALEVVAGGKLYSIVVDTDKTATALLQKGKLKKRVTIIPLNKIQGRSLPPKSVAAAKKLVGSKASPAIELVGYDGEVQEAMNFVFGSAFVCQDGASAETLVKQLRARCVTRDGDDYNPAGTLTGGSNKGQLAILAKLHVLAEAETALDQAREECSAATAQLNASVSNADEYERLQNEVDLQQKSFNLLEERLACNEASQLAGASRACEEEFASTQQFAQESADTVKEMDALIKKLKQDLKDLSGQKDKLLKEAKGRLDKAKKKEKAAKVAADEAQGTLQTVQSEFDAADTQKITLREQLAAAQEAISSMKEKSSIKEQEVAGAREKFDTAQAELDACKERLEECDAEISSLTRALKKGAAEANDVELKAKKNASKLTRLEQNATDAAAESQRLLRKHPWISSEKHLFGESGTDYDFNETDAEEARAQLADAEEAQERLGKKVNKKVMAMFEKAELDYAKLNEKKRTVEKDRQKIMEAIDHVDELKREFLKNAWQKVSKDFSSIYETLLPGSTARLVPPGNDESRFLEGLELNVAFNGVWKSLGELSGGQRSLVALSLILSLLLFNPAPVYILDEVDAALDPSHTQNMGQMIKAHFPQSQFVLVSLKEEMHNSADVLFETRLIDGVSTIRRSRGVQGGGKAKAKRGRAKGPLAAADANTA